MPETATRTRDQIAADESKNADNSALSPTAFIAAALEFTPQESAGSLNRFF